MSLKNDLNGIIPDDALHHLTNRFEVIGDIAILSLRPELNDYKKQIADGIVSHKKNIRTVLNKASKLEGDHRTAYYEFLAGTRTLTCHHEYGFLYRLDIGKVFFNSRLGFERKRVIDQVQPDELVLVPFCGVGPFAIPAAARHARVIAIEKNPEACYWLSENISINGVTQNVCIINRNTFDICLRPHKKFDRAIIPTPYGRDAILRVIASLVKKCGMIHFYTFKKWHLVPILIEEYERKGFRMNFFRSCGNVAPKVYRWLFDLIKSDPRRSLSTLKIPQKRAFLVICILLQIPASKKPLHPCVATCSFLLGFPGHRDIRKDRYQEKLSVRVAGTTNPFL